MLTTSDIGKIILDEFANVGECITTNGRCDTCKYYNVCNTLATAYRMVKEGGYFG